MIDSAFEQICRKIGSIICRMNEYSAGGKVFDDVDKNIHQHLLPLLNNTVYNDKEQNYNN